MFGPMGALVPLLSALVPISALAANNTSFLDDFSSLNTARWDWRGSYMISGSDSADSTHSSRWIALPSHLRFSATGLTMMLNDQPCASNGTACCCAGSGSKSYIPCSQNYSSQKTCARFASGHLLSKESFGYGIYEAAITFSNHSSATSYFDIGEHELCESPHEETQFSYSGGGDERRMIHTGYYTPGKHGDNPSKGHAMRHNLTFDPSEAEHIYRIEWQPSFITWWIDGHQIRNTTTGIPSPDPNGKGECSKIKFILRPNGEDFSGAAINKIRYLRHNSTGEE